MSFRFANLEGRASLLLENDSLVVDLARATDGQVPEDPMLAIARWDWIQEWASARSRVDAAVPLADPAALGPCVPRPGKIFGIGLNYRDHVEEAGIDPPSEPLVFAKFLNALSGPRGVVKLLSDRVDWEVELVVVMGRGCYRVAASDALAQVAGYCVGQDISDRRLQFSGKPPQFSMGKSIDGYGPIGPGITPLASLRDPHDLEILCEINGESMQKGRTKDMIFGVAELIAYLSRYCSLEVGDLIFTGTPSGVGSLRDPRIYLKPGDEIRSTIEGLGSIVNSTVVG